MGSEKYSLDEVKKKLYEVEIIMNARFDSMDYKLDSMINRLDSLHDNFDSIDLQLKESGSLLNKIDKNMNLLISKTHDVKKEIECLKDWHKKLYFI